MKDDDFELSLFPEEDTDNEEEFSGEGKAPVFDWQKEDPQDFSHPEPPLPEEKNEPQDFEQPLFVQDTFAHENAEQKPLPVSTWAEPQPAAQPEPRETAAVPPRQVPPATVPVQEIPPVQAQPAPAPMQEIPPVQAAPVQNAPRNAAWQPAQASAQAPRYAEQAAPAPVVQERVANGHTVLISGGDRGIGAATAKLLWQEGYHTAILYNKNEDAARQLINTLGRDCVAVRCDVSSREACEAAMRVVVRTFGDPDVLICNAGIAQQKLFTDLTEEDWRRMIDVDLTGAFHLCQLCLPGMIRRKYGRIINVSSMWGQTGGSCEAHYSAAKAGIIGLTKALAKEEGPSGITANCVAPGVIETDMMNAFSMNDKKALAEETPVGRLGSAQEVARMIAFLAREESGYITGQVFGINGGLVI